MVFRGYLVLAVKFKIMAGKPATGDAAMLHTPRLKDPLTEVTISKAP